MRWKPLHSITLSTVATTEERKDVQTGYVLGRARTSATLHRTSFDMTRRME